MDQPLRSHKKAGNLTGKEFQQKVREADALTSQGRLQEAEQAYKALLQRLHAWMINVRQEGRQAGPSARNALALLEKRLVKVQEKTRVYEAEEAHLNIQHFRNRLKNADFYARRGLTAEAEIIYKDLIERIKTWHPYSLGRDIIPIKAADLAISLINDKILALQSSEPSQSSGVTGPRFGAESDDHIILWLAGASIGDEGALKGIDAIVRKEPVEKRGTRPLSALAEYLFQSGEYRLAASIYQDVLDEGAISGPQLTQPLESLAKSYDKLDDKRKALRAYSQLLDLDRSRTEIGHRVKELRKELREIRLSIATVTDHPRFFFFCSLLIILFFMSFIPLTETVNNVDYFTIENHPEMEYYEEFKEVFGNDEFFVIAFQDENLFTREGLLFLSDLTEALEYGLQDVEDVKSLANVNDIIGEEEYFEVRKFMEDIPDDPSELARLKEMATSNPLYVNALVSRDGKTASVVVEVYNREDDENYRKNLLAQTESILEPFKDRVEAFQLAGWTVTNVRLSEYMNKDVSTFIPLTYALITLAIWVFFRNITLTFLAILNITVCVGSVMGLFGLTGIKLNNVTSIIPSMVMALALCDTVHIFSHMDRSILHEAGGDRRTALAAVLRLVIVPSFLTTLTTAVGFLSQGVSEIPPIREFAWIASAGMLFEFLYSFFFLPPLILLFKPEGLYRTYQRNKGISRYLNWNFSLIQRHHVLIFVFFVFAMILAGWLTMGIRVENSAIGCFKKSSSLRQSLDFVQGNLGGVDSLDISMQANQVDAFKEPENLEVMEKIQKYLITLDGVDQTISLVDFLKDMNESFHEENPSYYKIPDSKDMVSQYLLLYSADDIEDVINSTYDRARIAIRISFDKTSDQEKLISHIRSYLAQNITAEHLDIRVTGRAIENVVTIGSLIKGQVYSLALAAAIVSLIMFLALRSISIGFLSIFPNMLPILVNFGIMGALAIPLDTGTAIIAAVAIGIAVDDTIHFLSEYKNRRASGIRIPRALQMVLFLKGRALFSSSLILCIGFSVVIFSSFIPTMHFGVLTAIVMITALVGDTYFLPSIIMLRKNKAS